MAVEIWPVNLTPADKERVTELARRRAALGLVSSYAETIRSAIALALSAHDDDLERGKLSDD